MQAAEQFFPRLHRFRRPPTACFLARRTWDLVGDPLAWRLEEVIQLAGFTSPRFDAISRRSGLGCVRLLNCEQCLLSQTPQRQLPSDCEGDEWHQQVHFHDGKLPSRFAWYHR
jgi:hypothetical protein